MCDRGANIEARDIIGYRPLHRAAINGHISVVKELIEERNAEINARAVDGRTALVYARYRNEPDVAAYLVSHGGLDLGVFDDDDDDDLDFDDDDDDDDNDDNVIDDD